ncbi:MAG: hypothetical protein ACLRFM_01680 [Alphaproteobacteria bacterium]
MSKQYKYPKNWFKHNLIAVPTGFAGGNCSACIFRNAEKYCNKLVCSCFLDPNDSLNMESVYWIGRETHANIGTWTELVDFFNTVPKQKIREISNDIKNRAVLSRHTQNQK